MENDHFIDWSEVKILKVEHDYLNRLFTESWYGTSMKSSKCSTEMTNYYSCCLQKVA